MYNEVKELLITIIRCALNGYDLTDEVKAGIHPDTVLSVLKLSSMHKILPMVSDVLLKNGVLKSNESVGAEARRAQLRSVYRSQTMQHELSNVIRLFEENGIEFVPLKGSVVRELYPEPWMRTSCDIDILIKETQMSKAEGLLTDELHYVRKTASFHDVSYDSPSGVRLELHFDLVEEKVNKKMAEALDGVWEYTVPVGNSGHRRMTAEMFMLYHIAHMAKHMLSGGCGVRMFIDLYLMCRDMKTDTIKLDELLKRASLKSFADACQRLCDVWFSNVSHTELTQNLEEFIIRGGVFGTSDNKATIMTLKGKSKVKSFLNAVFLPKQNLVAIFPNLKKRPWLMPFYQVKRWFKVFNPSKRKLLKRELAINTKNDSEKTTEISTLMSKLELLDLD